jgi:hypothetical protein
MLFLLLRAFKLEAQNAVHTSSQTGATVLVVVTTDRFWPHQNSDFHVVLSFGHTLNTSIKGTLKLSKEDAILHSISIESLVHKGVSA